MELFVFVAASIMVLAGAIGVVTRSNPVHAALSMVLTLFGVAVMFVSLEAHFLAAVQVIVYAGAIVVLFLFVIMMFDLRKNQPESKSNLTKLAGSVVAGSLLVVLIALIRQNNFMSPKIEGFNSQTGMVENLGKVLYSEYLLPFELVSILFFVAMVGAVLLGKREAGERNF